MPFLTALIYLLLVFGVGAFFLRVVFRAKIAHLGYAVLCSGVAGASIVSFLFLGLAHTGLLTPTGVISALLTVAVASGLGWRSFIAEDRGGSFPETCATWWRSLDRWDRLALAVGGRATTRSDPTRA
jgi:hypothetical protein